MDLWRIQSKSQLMHIEIGSRLISARFQSFMKIGSGMSYEDYQWMM